MKIRVPTTPEQLRQIEDQLNRYKQNFAHLKRQYEQAVKDNEKQIAAYEKFWAENTKPIYSRNYDRPYNPDKLHETKSVWIVKGISPITLGDFGEWCCEKCKEPVMHKYIATGHDHTDYSYEVCDCEGVQGNKAWKDLN